MNYGKGWKPELHKSYLLDYSESGAKNFTQGTTRFEIRPLKVSAPEPSLNLSYRKNSKMTIFFLLGFSIIKP